MLKVRVIVTILRLQIMKEAMKCWQNDVEPVDGDGSRFSEEVNTSP